MQLTLMLVLMYESHGGRSIRLATSFRKSLTSASVSAANVTCTHRRISSAKEVIRYRRRHFVCLLVGRIAKNHSTDFLKVRRRGSTWVTAGLTLRLDDGRAVPPQQCILFFTRHFFNSENSAASAVLAAGMRSTGCRSSFSRGSGSFFADHGRRVFLFVLTGAF